MQEVHGVTSSKTLYYLGRNNIVCEILSTKHFRKIDVHILAYKIVMPCTHAVAPSLGLTFGIYDRGALINTLSFATVECNESDFKAQAQPSLAIV